CGGKGGVMESACKGCHDFNGISVGILPSISPDEANQYVTIKIPTNMGENRNFLVVQSSDILICIAGVLGTRIEANYSLKLNKTLITIPKSGGVSEEFYNKYVNNKNYRVFSAKNGIDAVNLAFSLLEKNKI
ncbi:MAG: TIGR00725 family protein, partial [Candidatus Helarchaeota archaeon]